MCSMANKTNEGIIITEDLHDLRKLLTASRYQDELVVSKQKLCVLNEASVMTCDVTPRKQQTRVPTEPRTCICIEAVLQVHVYLFCHTITIFCFKSISRAMDTGGTIVRFKPQMIAKLVNPNLSMYLSK